MPGWCPLSIVQGAVCAVVRRSRIGPIKKKYLPIAALLAIQVEGEVKAYYARQLAKGQHKMSVLNAVRTQRVLRVCACIRSNQLYDPDYSYQGA